MRALLVTAAALFLAAALPAHARAATPVAWCGGDRVSQNRVPEVEVSSRRQIHVVYAVPSDGADRFGEFAGGIVSDVASIDEWWRGQDPSRSPRFDLYPFAGCATRMGQLDLSFVRLPRPASAYLDINSRVFEIGTDLEPVVGATMKALVYYDGAVTEDRICGTSPGSPTATGRFGTAVVFVRACQPYLRIGVTTNGTAAHELTHDLGSVLSGAPHRCPESGHVCDSSQDLMWPFVQTLDTAILDVGRDDYYGHSGSQFDVQDSTFLMHLPQFPLTLGVEAEPGTAGRIRTSLELECPPACSLVLDNGLQVALEAVPDANSRFVGWSGACTGSERCALTMSGPQTATARFAPARVQLTVAVRGSGRVTSNPAGIACPKRCTASVLAATPVRLTAKPAKRFRFKGWSGACRGTRATCTLTLEDAARVRATFAKR